MNARFSSSLTCESQNDLSFFNAAAAAMTDNSLRSLLGFRFASLPFPSLLLSLLRCGGYVLLLSLSG